MCYAISRPCTRVRGHVADNDGHRIKLDYNPDGIREKTTREIGAFQAKNTFGTLLDWVADGEEVVITRRGKPAARLVPVGASAAESSHRVAAAVERIRARAKSADFAPVTQAEWDRFRNEGHR